VTLKEGPYFQKVKEPDQIHESVFFNDFNTITQNMNLRQHFPLPTPCTPAYSGTAYCIWRVISSISNLNPCSSSLGFFCHVPLKRDQGDWNWKLRLDDTANAIDCTAYRVAKTYKASIVTGHFPQNPMISGSFAKRDLQLRLDDTPNARCCALMLTVVIWNVYHFISTLFCWLCCGEFTLHR